MGNLSNLYISRSYQSLIHLETDNTASSTLVGLQDGLGNSIGISVNTSGSLSISGSFTASLANGYAWVGDGNNRTSLVPTSSFGSVTSAITGSSLITASFSGNTLTFTKGDSSQFGVVIPDVSGSGPTDISALNAFTQSQDTKNSTLATYTGSVDTKFSTIGSQSGSWDNTSLNSFTASQQLLNTTFATTGSNVFRGNESITGSLVVTGSFILWSQANNSSIISASLDGMKTTFRNNIDLIGPSPTLTIRPNFGVNTGSYSNIQVKFINSGKSFAELNNTGLDLYSGSASGQTIHITGDSSALGDDSYTANRQGLFLTTGPFIFAGGKNLFTIDTSYVGKAYTDANLNFSNGLTITSGSLVASGSANISGSLTASLANGFTFVGNGSGITTAVPTSSFISTPTDISALNAFTQSQETKNSTLATYTASIDTKFSTLGSQSGSWITESETGSFARTNVDNNFSVNQTFTNITAVSASFTYLQTLYETSSVIYSSGSNQFGDELSDIQTLSGSVKIQGSLTINGTPVLTSSVDISSLNAFTQSQDTKNSTLATYTGSVDTKFTTIGTQSGSWDNTALNSFTQSVDTKFTAVGSSTASLNSFTSSQETKNSTLATYTGSVNTFITASAQRLDLIEDFTQSAEISITNLNSATASLFTSASLALVTASLSGNTITFTKGDTTTFGFQIPDVSGSDISALNAFTQSQDTKNSTLATYTGSNDTKWNTLGGQTGSYVTSQITGSSIVTASVNNDDITFTKGDGSQFTIQVATGSFAATASLAQDALDIVVNVKNTTGTQINKGTVVRIIGATGDNALIGTASWEDDNNSANTLGFVVTDIPNDAFGRVMTQGTLLSVNTDPALGYTAGQLVYLSGSGQFTNVIPPAPYHEVRLGQVLRAQQNNGSIYVLIQNGYELTELHDVDISTGSLANNNLLAWDSASAQWENKTLTEVGGLTTSSFQAYTGSVDTQFIAVGSSTASLNSYTSSQDTKNSTLATYTGSVDTKFNTIGTQSGSWDNTSLNSFTQSVDSKFTAVGESTASLNAYTQSNDTKWSTLGGLTGSYVTSAITGSSLVTASFSGNTLTFTKGDSSTFGVLIPDVSGSDLSSLNAFTSSQLSINAGYNTFTSSQETKNSTLATYTGSVNTFITASEQRLDLIEDATASLFTSTSLSLTTASFSGNTLTFTKGDNTTFGVVIPGISGSTIPAGTISGSEQITALGFVSSSVTGSSLVTGSVSGNVLTFTKGDASQFSLTVATGSGGGGTIDTGSFATTGSNIFTGNQTIQTSSILTVGSDDEYIRTAFNTLTLNNKTAVFTNFQAPDTFFQANGNFAFQNTIGGNGSGSMNFLIQNGGSYTTQAQGGGTIGFSTNTGSISFTTPGEINLQGAVRIKSKDSGNSVTIVNSSGSLLYTAAAFTTASAHLSQSAPQNTVNFVFKTNNNTPDTIISGSSNIFTNPAAPTAGFKRYVGGSGNIVLGTNAPQISGSMAFSPALTGNYFGSNGIFSMRGPVSSSAYTIAGNSILGTVNVGPNATNNAQKLTSGLNLSTNVVVGTLNITAIGTALTGSPTPSVATNVIAGAVTLNVSQSAMQYVQNIGGGVTINNNFYSQSLGLVSTDRFPVVNNNSFNGTGNTITFSGSHQSGWTGSSDFDILFQGNTLAGISNGVYYDLSNVRVVDGRPYDDIQATMIMGARLSVSGSSRSGDQSTVGSTFVGRFNAEDGNRNKTAETIFAVGTGTSGSAGITRKTGFLIDSGSNTFVEGTLNVSGSSTFNGDSLITGSLTVSGSATITGSVSVSNVLSLAQLDPLPGGADGQLAVSASNLYFFSGSAWNKIAFG